MWKIENTDNNLEIREGQKQYEEKQMKLHLGP